MTLLQVEAISSSYGDLRALRNVNLAVESGRVTGLLGRNGAGKTTALRAISGLNTIQSGRLLLEGADISKVPPHRRARAGIAYVQEGKRVFRSRTVHENLVLGTYANPSQRRARAAIDDMYDRFPLLAERRTRLAASLSGGQQQILAIAQALVAEPNVLLLDEPSAGLAPTIVAQVADAIRDLRDRGLAVLLVEQAVELALAVSDSIVVLDLGVSVFEAESDDPTLREAITHAYLANGVKTDRQAQGGTL